MFNMVKLLNESPERAIFADKMENTSIKSYTEMRFSFRLRPLSFAFDRKGLKRLVFIYAEKKTVIHFITCSALIDQLEHENIWDLIKHRCHMLY